MCMISLTLGANVVGMLSFDNDTPFPCASLCHFVSNKISLFATQKKNKK